MNMLIYHSIFIAIYAILYSALEIEMEGKDGGWAKNLPTVPSGIGELTIYHCIMNIIIILTVAYSTRLVNKKISIIIFFTIAWFLIEDFIWFILNPHFTFKKYTKKDIWWHGKQLWILGSPLHNWIGFIAMGIFAYISKEKILAPSMMVMLSIVLFTIYISPFFHKWHNTTHIEKNIDNDSNENLIINKEEEVVDTEN